MITTADITTGEQRIIGFLLSPIPRSFAEAGQKE